MSDASRIPSPRSRSWRWAGGLVGAALLLLGGRAVSDTLRARDPRLLGGADAPPLSLAGHTRLGGPAIRSGFTSMATRAVHELVRAFEARRVDVMAGLVDVDYELDYHRLLHDLESYFARTDQVDMNMDLLSVEPLPEGFAAEVRWRKTYRVKRTGHRVAEEGHSHLVFDGHLPPRLRSIRGELPF